MERYNHFINPYCYKILPLVYDDSLSYYEFLCKLTKTVNQLIDGFNDDFTDIVKENINKHFNRLMGNVLYTEETETIHFTIETIIEATGCEHIYSSKNKDMEIK